MRSTTWASGNGQRPEDEEPGQFTKTFEVEGWGRAPIAGEGLRIAHGDNAPIVPIKSVTFGVDGSVTLSAGEVKHGPGRDRGFFEREGWQEW